jgi:hypothetical protein
MKAPRDCQNSSADYPIWERRTRQNWSVRRTPKEFFIEAASGATITNQPPPGPYVARPFGAFPPMKTHMAEDLKQGPPFGVIKIRVPGQQIVGPTQERHVNQNSHVGAIDEQEHTTMG